MKIYEIGDKIGTCIYDGEYTNMEGEASGLRMAYFICLCGKRFKCVVTYVKTGSRTNCGCLNKPLTFTTHGLNKGNKSTPELKTWYNMRNRVSNPNNPLYPYYGERGVKICDRWLSSPLNFIEDMGLRPSPLHSLDRFPDMNGDYEKTNCRWATKEQQSSNTRRNVFLTFNGQTNTATQWAKIVGISTLTIFSRIRHKWTVENILTKKTNTYNRKNKHNAA